MRYSPNQRLAIVDVHKDQRRGRRPLRHDEFFKRIEDECSPEDRMGGVLLVGGISPADLRVRFGQADARLDRAASHWSHAAIVLHWPNGARLDQVIGAEVALDPEDPDLQVPERNGVTLFRLSRYKDARRYPNLAFGTLLLDGGGPRPKRGEAGAGQPRIDKALKDQIVSAVLDPCRDRARYPLWENLGAWLGFVHGSRGNPLHEHLAHPGAALVDYAYASVGFDVTPGSEAPDTSPETLWSTLLYWYRRLSKREPKATSLAPMSEGVGAWLSMTQEDSLRRISRSISLRDDFTSATTT